MTSLFEDLSTQKLLAARLYILKTVLFDGHLSEKVTSPRAQSAIREYGPTRAETVSILCLSWRCCLTLYEGCVRQNI